MEMKKNGILACLASVFVIAFCLCIINQAHAWYNNPSISFSSFDPYTLTYTLIALLAVFLVEPAALGFMAAAAMEAGSTVEPAVFMAASMAVGSTVASMEAGSTTIACTR